LLIEYFQAQSGRQTC